jgi:nuclear protein localization family protein 4
LTRLIPVEQVYRHVDNIMFEDKNIVDRFLEGWRRSGGLQRVGFLYGRYEEYEKVSLGIKAVVAAIYEPPQTCTKYSVQLEEDPHAHLVDEMAGHLGLRKVIGYSINDCNDN